MKKTINTSLAAVLIALQLTGSFILMAKKAYADPAINQSAGSWNDTFLDNNPTNSTQDGISASTGIEAASGNLRLKNIPWYNFSWDYRAPITITNLSSGSLTNYQVSLTIDTATLIGAGKMQVDGDDIIFTNYTSSAVYDYWIESGINTFATKIWVEVPSLDIGPTIIQMYYDNSGASAASSYANTMENPPVVWWNQTYDSGFDDQAYGIAVDSDNNVIVAGYVTNVDLNTDIFITKYDTNGNVVAGWPKTYDGGVVADDVATSIAVDSAGNIIVAGRSWNRTDFDLIIIKYNPDGTPFWSGLDGVGGVAKIYDGVDMDSANGVAVDLSDDSIIVTGDTTIPATWNTNFITIKYDSAGTFVWSETYDNALVADSWDRSNAISVDSEGNIVVAGFSQNNDATYENDFYTIKYDSLGNVVWEKRYSNALNNEANEVNAVAIDSSGNVVVTGRSTDASFFDDFRAIKYSSSDGTVSWNNIYDVGDSDIANGAAIDRNNNIIIAGQIDTTGDWNYGILKYDSGGNIIWNTIYDSGGTPDSGQAVAIDNDNNILVTGYNATNDFYTIKYSEHKYADVVPTYLFGAELAKADSGTATSVDIIPTTIYGWIEFSWQDNEPAETDIKYTLEAWNSIISFWDVPVLKDASNNSNGEFDKSPVDLSGLDYNVYSKARLKADLSTTDESTTPSVSEWQVTWNTQDNVSPTITSITTVHADGSFKEGEVIDITVVYDEAVDVVTTGGTPAMALNSGGSAVYNSGTGTAFRYTVGAGETSTDLDYSATNSLALNGGTIKDAAGNNAVLTLASPGTAGSLGNNKAIIIDTTAPTVALTYSPDRTVKSGDTVTITTTFSEAVSETVVPAITIATLGDGDLPATNMTKISTTVWTYNWNVPAGNDENGAATITISATDLAGNANQTAANNTRVIDNIAPPPPSSGGGGTYTPPTSSVVNTSISINNGAVSTNNTAVTLTIGATNATKMVISNSADFTGAVWETYAASKAWTLTSGDGVKTVYIKFQDAAGIATAAISDTITLDTKTVLPVYPDGALLKSSSEEKVYVIKNGEKEWIKTAEEFIAGRYKWEDIKIISKEELDAIPVRGSGGGSNPNPNPNPNPIGGFPDGALIKIPDSFRVYIIIDQKKKWIATPEVFETLGYKWGNITIISKLDLDKIIDYEDNLIRALGDYKVYLVVNGIKRHIPNPEIFLDYGFLWEDINDVSQAIIDKYSRGYLIRESRQEKIYYLSSTGIKKWIPNPEIFASYNNKWEDIQVISKKEMESYPESNIMRYADKLYLISGIYKKLIPSDVIFTKNKYNRDLILDANKTEFDWYKTGAAVK